MKLYLIENAIVYNRVKKKRRNMEPVDMKRIKILFLLAVSVLLFFCFGCEKKETEAVETNEVSETEQTPAEKAVIKSYIEPSMINRFGNIYTDVAKQAFYDAGFELGDILTIRLMDQEVDAPLVTSYSDITSLSTGIFALYDCDVITLAINMGDFASYYGIAEKITDGDQVTWKLKSDKGEPVEIEFSLKEKGGYLDEYIIMQLEFSNERSDYPLLSDEEFANFRNITTTGMGKNVLYRSSSTVDDLYKRAGYADKAAENHHVAYILNLTDDEAVLNTRPGYEETYFSSVNHLAKNINLDVKSEENRKDTAEFMRIIANNKGPYLVQCLQGKDRTGYFCGILESLMGASYDEVVDDYMVTYYNWFGVTKLDESYQIIADNNIINTLHTVFETDDLKNADLQDEAYKYLLSIGLSEKEIEDIKTNLSTDYPD